MLAIQSLPPLFISAVGSSNAVLDNNVQEWAWLCSKKTSFTKTELAPSVTDLCLVGETHEELDNDEIVRRVNPAFKGESPPRLEQWGRLPGGGDVWFET